LRDSSVAADAQRKERKIFSGERRNVSEENAWCFFSMGKPEALE
jgi:hypothetical protein